MSEPSVLDRIQTDLVAAMKSRDAATLGTLRMLKSALIEAKMKKPKDAALAPDEAIEVVQRYVRRRREAIEEWRRHGQDERAASEQREIEVASRYLPQPLPEEEIKAIVQEVVAATGAAGPRDLGRVMGPVMARVKGRAEGGVVSRLVKEALGG